MAYRGKEKKYYWPGPDGSTIYKELGKAKAYKTKGS